MPCIASGLREAVRRRALGRCEYCQLPDSVALSPFHVEHIIPLKHRGATDAGNLAWSCLQCNLSKGSDLAGYDTVTSRLTALFNPRQQRWEDHFEMRGAIIVGLTAEGRVTIAVLQMNVREQIAIRKAAMRKGLW